MNIDAILTSTPINKTAARVIGVRRGFVPEGDLSRAEIVALLTLLQRKMRLLKVVLKIDTKAKHVNLIYKAKRGMRTYRGAANPRAVAEYIRVGQEIQRMSRTLQEMRAQQTGAAVRADGWEKQHD